MCRACVPAALPNRTDFQGVNSHRARATSELPLNRNQIILQVCSALSLRSLYN